jgi:hypothetical protein
VNGSWVGLMLTQSKGHLVCLNVHTLESTNGPYSLPSLESLRPYWTL